MMTFMASFEQRRRAIVSHSINKRSVLQQNFDDVIVTHLTCLKAKIEFETFTNFNVIQTLTIQSGVAPSLLGTSAFAPAANNMTKTVRWPFCALIKSGVARSYETKVYLYTVDVNHLNFTFMKAFTLAPAFKSSLTIFACPP